MYLVEYTDINGHRMTRTLASKRETEEYILTSLTGRGAYEVTRVFTCVPTRFKRETRQKEVVTDVILEDIDQ